LTYQIKSMKLTLSVQSSYNKSHHPSLLPKNDFIENTCPTDNVIVAFCIIG